jgi:hypothetical protein
MQFIDSYQQHLEQLVGEDRHLSPAWKSKYLVDRALKGDAPQSSRWNRDSLLAKAGAVNRVLEEYTVRDKVRYVLILLVNNKSISIYYDTECLVIM